MTNNKSNVNTSSSVEEVRTCLCCDKKLPIDAFDKHGKTKIKRVCRACRTTVRNSKSQIGNYTIQELLRELRERGVKGKFTYTKVETIEI